MDFFSAAAFDSKESLTAALNVVNKRPLSGLNTESLTYKVLFRALADFIANHYYNDSAKSLADRIELLNAAIDHPVFQIPKEGCLHWIERKASNQVFRLFGMSPEPERSKNELHTTMAQSLFDSRDALNGTENERYAVPAEARRSWMDWYE